MSKRCFDLLAATVGLMVLLPLFIVIAAWIKVDSPGPVLFRQARVGRFGRPFRIHKFRTMVVEAPQSGPAITVGRDPRITRAGGFLRRHKLDELPQLLDVLAGDMSLVGPRPEVERYVALYPEGVRAQVLSIRPGITDECALEFRNESELLASAANPEDMYVKDILPRKLAMYQQYVGSRTFVGDIRILCRTIARLM